MKSLISTGCSLSSLPLLTSLAVGALGVTLAPGDARADTAPPPASTPTSAPSVVPVDDNQYGLVVVGLGNAIDIAWPLARAVYADAALRPAMLDEAHARVLVGEAPGEAGTAELRDLADTRASIHGDDAASRRLLQSIALSLHVKGIVVVEAGPTPESRPSARVFVTTSNGYDTVHYDSDAPGPVTWGNPAPVAWSGAVTSLHRSFGEAPPTALLPTRPPVAAAPPTRHVAPAQGISALVAIPALNDKPGEPGKAESKALYKSPWFWAAAGAALLGVGAVYLATRNSTDNIQLQVQVPR